MTKYIQIMKIIQRVGKKIIKKMYKKIVNKIAKKLPKNSSKNHQKLVKKSLGTNNLNINDNADFDIKKKKIANQKYYLKA